MINILFVLIQLASGGSERVALNLAKHLNHSHFNVYLAFFSGGHLLKAFEEICQQIFYVPKKDGLDIRAAMKISNIIRRQHIDIVNAHHYMPFFYSFLGGKLLSKSKLIYTEHTVEEVERLPTRLKRATNLMFYKTETAIGISKDLAEAFRVQYPAHSNKVVCIPNGIDVESFAFEIDRNKVRAEWGLTPENFVIGTVANFRCQKNHPCLLRAFDSVSKAYPNARLMLVGSSEHGNPESTESEVRDLVSAYKMENRVIFTGMREDVPRLLQAFDVFCLPSFYEGLPLSVLEAMAARIPVVGSNVRGIREVVIHEENGLLFPCNDHVVLSQALKQLLENDYRRETLRNKAFQHVSQYHGMGAWVKAYEQLFAQVVAEDKPLLQSPYTPPG